VDIWSRLFDLMLNHEGLEPLAELGEIRYGFIGGAHGSAWRRANS